MREVTIAGRKLGAGHPCFVAAEIGLNHNGDIELAKRSIDAAAEAGADGVKFQNYRTEDFLSDRSLTYEYISRGEKVREPQYDMFKRCELAPAALAQLRAHCEQRGVVFFSTPTSVEGVEDLVRVGAPLLKNGSDYLGNVPLVEAMGRTGVPTVLSTGMATLGEVDEAVRAFRGAGGRDLVLLHCTSSYPTPMEDVHLRKMTTLQAAFDCVVGLSDHTEGTVAAVGAVALGASFVEKHFTLDRNLPGPDHRFSSTPAELAELVAGVRAIERALGSSAPGPAASELHARSAYRLSCVASRPLRAGDLVERKDVAFRRPGNGLPPSALDWLLGHRLTRDVALGKAFDASDFG